MTVSKRCTKCGKTKPLDEFGRHPKRTDGHQSWCKACTRDWMREARATDPAQMARDTKQRRAYTAALTRLREARRDEFERYYAEELAMRGLSATGGSRRMEA